MVIMLTCHKVLDSKTIIVCSKDSIENMEDSDEHPIVEGTVSVELGKELR